MHAEDSAGSGQYTFFDRLERLVGSDASLGGGLRSREQIEYRADRLVDRQRDAKGQEVDLHYDAAGRLEKRTEDQGQTETDEEAGGYAHAYQRTILVGDRKSRIS